MLHTTEACSAKAWILRRMPKRLPLSSLISPPGRIKKKPVKGYLLTYLYCFPISTTLAGRRGACAWRPRCHVDCRLSCVRYVLVLPHATVTGSTADRIKKLEHLCSRLLLVVLWHRRCRQQFRAPTS